MRKGKTVPWIPRGWFCAMALVSAGAVGCGLVADEVGAEAGSRVAPADDVVPPPRPLSPRLVIDLATICFWEGACSEGGGGGWGDDVGRPEPDAGGDGGPGLDGGPAGVGDGGSAPDSDQDGIPDGRDTCPHQGDPSQEDADGDLIGDRCDVCPDVSDPEQSDEDDDGVGDACDETFGALTRRAVE